MIDKIRSMGIIWTGLFTILGGVITGAIGVYVGNVQCARQRSLDNETRTRDKLEDLSIMIESLRNDFWVPPTHDWTKMGGNWLLLPVMDPTAHIAKVNMLISLYAPTLDDSMVELVAQREIFRVNSELPQKWRAVEAIHSICDGMQKELIALSKQ
ncbi:MAG: hypothetical protein ABI210_11035, partial [Abditibacteriaceae bacterium]